MQRHLFLQPIFSSISNLKLILQRHLDLSFNNKASQARPYFACQLNIRCKICSIFGHSIDITLNISNNMPKIRYYIHFKLNFTSNKVNLQRHLLPILDLQRHLACQTSASGKIACNRNDISFCTSKKQRHPQNCCSNSF